MKKDTVIELKKLEVFAEDPLTEVLHRGAGQLQIFGLMNDASPIGAGRC